jgi:hypothetical protein
VSALRDALEAARIQHEQSVQSSLRDQQEEHRHLLQTLVLLREQLDQTRAAPAGATAS